MEEKIFITLGSQKFQFNRLLIAVDKLCEKKIICGEDVFAQIGYSDYVPPNYRYNNFLDREEFSMEMGKADIVITHGGTGAIIGAVKKEKKVIAVPRLAKYGEHVDDHQLQLIKQFDDLNLICPCRDAVYVVSPPKQHYQDIKTALEYKKHILCESPITVSKSECTELFSLAKKNGCILIDAIKTAYATAFARLILLAKEGKIGDIYSVDAVCTSLRPMTEDSWNSICGWGPTAMLPIFDILGTEYRSKNISSLIDKNGNDQFTKVDFSYDHAVASLKVGKGVKSEGELIISGTKGYIYVPAPWWKTDYFEIRYEDSTQNKRYFYQLDGEGIRYELVAFVKAINSKKDLSNIRQSVSETVCEVVEDFYGRKEMMLL